jgi:hypothetical protein
MEPSPTPTPPALGSLAQAARGKQLRQARNILVIIGILIMVGSLVDLAMARTILRRELEKEAEGLRAHHQEVDPAALQKEEDFLFRVVVLIDGGTALLGALFVVFGLIVRRYPVLITILSLVLFIGMIVVLGVLNPVTLAQGWLIKIIALVGLAKAVQAAIAYQREENARLAVEPTL